MLTDEIDQFLLSLITVRSPQTIIWYRKRLAPLRQIEKNISSVNLLDLQQIYAGLAERRTLYAGHPTKPSEPGPLSPATLCGYVRAWRAFFNWCIEAGLICANPARKLKLPRLPDQPPKAISRADMEKIVEAARRSSTRDYALVCILADSACRVGGLCALTLDNLDLDRAQAIVLEKGQFRFLLFTPRTVAAIRAYLLDRPQVHSSALFIGQKKTPLQTSGVYQLLGRLADSAGVQGRHNPHAFRHGWARAALSAGADLGDVAQLLGHRSVQTTYQFYGRWTTDELHALHARYTWLPQEALMAAI